VFHHIFLARPTVFSGNNIQWLIYIEYWYFSWIHMNGDLCDDVHFMFYHGERMSLGLKHREKCSNSRRLGYRYLKISKISGPRYVNFCC